MKVFLHEGNRSENSVMLLRNGLELTGLERVSVKEGEDSGRGEQRIRKIAEGIEEIFDQAPELCGVFPFLYEVDGASHERVGGFIAAEKEMSVIQEAAVRA